MRDPDVRWFQRRDPVDFARPACTPRQIAKPLKMRVRQHLSVARQRQFPSGRPGTFIRASLPRLRRSCNGIMQARGSAGVLLDRITTLVLALLIHLRWPSSSVWAIGTLVGVSMIISGNTEIDCSGRVISPRTNQAHRIEFDSLPRQAAM